MKISFSLDFEISAPALSQLVGDGFRASREFLLRSAPIKKTSEEKFLEQPTGGFPFNPSGEIPTDDDLGKNWDLRMKKLGVKRTA